MKKVLIAGVTSGSGKTTAVLGILKALNENIQFNRIKLVQTTSIQNFIQE